MPQGRNFNEMFDSIMRFYSRLPWLYSHLRRIGLQIKEDIRFKFAGNTRTFLKHPDNFIVYYDNSNNRNQIQGIIDTFFRHEGFAFVKRKIKAESGFDFKARSSTKEIVEDAQSHTQLVISVMVKEITSDIPKFSCMSKRQLMNWLIKKATEVSRWNEEDIHRVLYGT